MAKMLNIKMDMSVPNVALSFECSSLIGEEEQVVVGILLGIEGEIDGMTMFIFEDPISTFICQSTYE